MLTTRWAAIDFYVSLLCTIECIFFFFSKPDGLFNSFTFPVAAIRDRRWAPHSLGRVGVLVVTAQILVGVMGVTLAAWFLMWAPMLKFREVPHYAGVPVSPAAVSVCGAGGGAWGRRFLGLGRH